MKFDIRNMLVVLAVVLSSCALGREGRVTTSVSKGTIVFQEGNKLEGVNLDTGETSVLRDSFLEPNGRYNSWSVSPDGTSLAFAATPADVEFFSAAAYREYLFTTSFDGKQRVLLAAYGSRAVKGDFSFSAPSWSSDGQRLLVSQASVGNYPGPREAAIYDVKTRKEIWSSRALAPTLWKPSDTCYISLFNPALSPDGNDVVCFGEEMPNDGSAPEVWAESGQKAPPMRLVHFDLKRNSAEVLAVIEDQLSVGQRHMIDAQNSDVEPGVRNLRPRFAWHPTQKKFIFVGPCASDRPATNLFSFDLRTHKMARFTEGDDDDTSPQWSLDGNSVIWLRNFQIFRANADGSNPTRIVPRLAGMTQIQLVPHIANWSRYRQLSIRPLAGQDK